MALNRAEIIGNLGNDPELKSTPSGNSVCNFSVATNEKWKDKEGNEQERTEWHRVVVWGKSAESCAKFLSKGRQVFVEGKLQTRSWENKDGVKMYTTEIIAKRVDFLGAKEGGGGNRPPPPGDNDAPPMNQDGDIPF